MSGREIGIYLALRKKWRAVVVAGLVVVLCNVIAGAMIGFDDLLFHYSSVGPKASVVYQGDAWNLSVYSMGWKLLGGFYSPLASFFSTPPPVSSLAPFAPYAAMSFTLLLTVASLYFALRSRTFDAAFGILVCASILVNPVAWSHYFTWLLIPIVVAGRALYELKFPRFELRMALLCFLILIYSWGFVLRFPHSMAQLTVEPMLLNLLGALLYLPTFGVFVLMMILVRIDRRSVDRLGS